MTPTLGHLVVPVERLSTGQDEEEPELDDLVDVDDDPEPLVLEPDELLEPDDADPDPPDPDVVDDPDPDVVDEPLDPELLDLLEEPPESEELRESVR